MSQKVSRCETCWPETGCYRPKHYFTYWVWTRYDEDHVDEKDCDVGTKVDEYGHVEGDTAAEQEVAATIRGSTLLRISAFWGFSICRKRAEILSLLSKGQIDQI